MDVLANNLRLTIRKDVPFIPGAWVEFWDSITIGEMKTIQAKGGTLNIDDTIDLLIAQIANWNFTDNNVPLPITRETFEKLSLKFMSWFTQTQTEILSDQAQAKKK